MRFLRGKEAVDQCVHLAQQAFLAGQHVEGKNDGEESGHNAGYRAGNGGGQEADRTAQAAGDHRGELFETCLPVKLLQEHLQFIQPALFAQPFVVHQELEGAVHGAGQLFDQQFDTGDQLGNHQHQNQRDHRYQCQGSQNHADGYAAAMQECLQLFAVGRSFLSGGLFALLSVPEDDLFVEVHQNVQHVSQHKTDDHRLHGLPQQARAAESIVPVADTQIQYEGGHAYADIVFPFMFHDRHLSFLLSAYSIPHFYREKCHFYPVQKIFTKMRMLAKGAGSVVG